MTEQVQQQQQPTTHEQQQQEPQPIQRHRAPGFWAVRPVHLIAAFISRVPQELITLQHILQQWHGHMRFMMQGMQPL